MLCLGATMVYYYFIKVIIFKRWHLEVVNLPLFQCRGDSTSTSVNLDARALSLRYSYLFLRLAKSIDEIGIDLGVKYITRKDPAKVPAAI